MDATSVGDCNERLAQSLVSRNKHVLTLRASLKARLKTFQPISISPRMGFRSRHGLEHHGDLSFSKNKISTISTDNATRL